MKYEWIAFTDGGYKDKVATIGGTVINAATGDRIAYSKKVKGEGTNNTAELCSILYALQQVTTAKSDTRVIVSTDSQYAIGVLVKGHKAKANQELVIKVKKEIAKFASVELRWVRGHSGHEGNTIADSLAKKARKEKYGNRNRNPE